MDTHTATNTHSITLPFGIQKKDKEPIRRIVFGHRPTVADSIAVEDDPQGALDTQKSLMYVRAAITEYGEKKGQPFLSDLLGLNRADRDALIEGYIDFLGQSKGPRAAEKVDTETAKLAFGLTEGDGVFDLITLCDKADELSGYEELELEKKATGDYELMCTMLGYSIAHLSQSNGGAVIEGPIGVERIRQLDVIDLNFIVGLVGERKRSFRRSRAGVHASDGDRSAALSQ
jgi:hypothetical protein